MKRHTTLLVGLLLMQTALLAQSAVKPFFILPSPYNQGERSAPYLGKNNPMADSISTYYLNDETNEYEANPNMISYPIYDAQGRVVEEISRSTQSSFRAKSVMTYDSYGLVEQKEYMWSTAANDWNLDSRYVYGRNAQGVDTSFVHYYWDESSGTELITFGYVIEITNDTLGRGEFIVTSEYNQSSGWMPTSRFSLTYEGLDSLPTEYLIEAHDGNAWQLKNRYINFTWGFDSGVIAIKRQPQSYFIEDWVGAEWVLSGYDSSVHQNNRLTENFRYSFDSQDSSFDILGHQINEFDARGNNTLLVVLDYSSGQVDTFIYQSNHYTYGPNDEVLEHEMFSTSSGGYPFGSKDIYHYSTTGISKLSPLNYSLFPNPVSNGSVLTIQGEPFREAELIDLQGKRLKVMKPEGGQSIRIENVLPGLYLLQIEFENGRTAQDRISVY